MFTGLVETLAIVTEIVAESPGKRLVVRSSQVAAGAVIGDSICVLGCCLTVVAKTADTLAFEAGPETLARTNLGQLQVGDGVNLERSVRVGDRLGGHFVTGHIDGLATITERHHDGEWATIWFQAPSNLARQIVSKGSVAIDGISLTVVAVEQDRFSVQLIPHTLAVTTLGTRRAGDSVNLETDLLAKYVEAQLASRLPMQSIGKQPT